MKDRELYSIEDARFLLGGIARKTIYDLLNEGELSSVIIGRRRFIPGRGHRILRRDDRDQHRPRA